MIICLGPICIPLWGLLPFVLLYGGRLWNWIKRKLGFPVAEAAPTPKQTNPDGTTVTPSSSKDGPIVVADDEQWKAIIQETTIPVIVDFTATWCGPCRNIAPYFEELAKANPGALFIKVDVDQLQETASQARVSAMPTFQSYLNGKKVDEFLGADRSKLAAMVQRQIAAAAK